MMKTVEITNKQERFQVVRWINLGVGLLQLYYWWFGAAWYVLLIGVLNIGVWALTRQIQAK